MQGFVGCLSPCRQDGKLITEAQLNYNGMKRIRQSKTNGGSPIDSRELSAEGLSFTIETVIQTVNSVFSADGVLVEEPAEECGSGSPLDDNKV